MGLGIVRVGLLVVGGVLLLGGLAAVLVGGEGGLVAAGLWAILSGGVLLAAVVLERFRYRSEHAERTSAPPGPGGGEELDAPLERRFQRTDEVFEDPTSRVRMRVWLDPATGERRYRAEGAR